MNWFMSDPHFGHGNIIRYCDRPFPNSKIMDKVLLRNINEMVAPEDTIYFVGDFSIFNTSRQHYIGSIVERIPGRKILILGNHDYLAPFKYIELGFWSVHTSLQIVVDGHKIALAHDPALQACIEPDEIFICGHVHRLFKALPEKRTVNVGVENWDYRPVTLQQILDILQGE